MSYGDSRRDERLYRSPDKSMVNIGIIGLGPIWETRYAPVLHKYRDRICVRAVFDPVARRAEEVAAHWSAAPVQGALALLNRSDVRAVLLLDSAWHGLRTLEFACQRKKPTYIAAILGFDADRLRKIYEAGRAEGLTLMPEMSRRHAPSTARLHELMATQLGRPTRIVVEAQVGSRVGLSGGMSESDAEFLVGLVDWCRYVVRSPLLQVEMADSPSAEAGKRRDRTITIRFTAPRVHAPAAMAELRLRATVGAGESTAVDLGEPLVRYDVECERGSATILSAVEIRWQTNGKPVSETLTSDRPDVEVLIDHFCRRALGGLIPVPDIADVCRGLEVISAAHRSLASGEAVPLNGRA